VDRPQTFTHPVRELPFEVLLCAGKSGLPRDSKVQAQQIRTIAKERIKGTLRGHLDSALMAEVDEAMRLHLDLR
jgi:mRNA interferase MazF